MQEEESAAAMRHTGIDTEPAHIRTESPRSGNRTGGLAVWPGLFRIGGADQAASIFGGAVLP